MVANTWDAPMVHPSRAPQAMRVADRFHVLRNLAETIRESLRKHEHLLLQALHQTEAPHTSLVKAHIRWRISGDTAFLSDVQR